MKNLKKVLSLALAFAMVLGLCIGASAAQDVTTLKDWDEVENKSAATLLNAFSIMQGHTDGTFAPNDNVTRAQAAKMISVALWGGKDDAALYAAGNVGGYTDVTAGEWYNGYVNYMTVQGIVAGKGEGKFDPEGNVTGYELLKMCLVALGYDAETEGLVGSGWDLKTMALATKRGTNSLTENAKVTDWSAPLSRMNAATIIANMIWRETVKYSEGKVEGTNKTFATDVLGMTETKGVLLANEFGTMTTQEIDKTARNYAGQNAIIEAKKADGTSDGYYEVEVDSTAADLGNTVTMYIVGKSDTARGTVVSTVINDAVEVTPKFVKNSTTNKFSITNVDTKDDPTSAKYFVNGTEDATNQADIETLFSTVGAMNEKGDAFVVNGNAEIKYLDTNGDGYIDLVKAYTYTLETVTKDDGKDKEGNEQYSIGTTTVLKSACDFEAKKGDKVWITSTTGNCFKKDSGTTYHGVIAETKEGEITRLGTGVVYIDNVKNTDATTGDNTITAADLGKTGTFYLNLAGNVHQFVAEQGQEDSSNTYAVLYAGVSTPIQGGALTSGITTTYETKVAAILEDGTVGEYTVVKVNGKDVTKADAFATTADAETGAGSLVGLGYAAGATSGTNTTNYLVKYTLDGTKMTVVGAPTEITTTGGTDAENVKDGKAGDKVVNAKTISFMDASTEAGEKWVVVKGTDVFKNVDAEGEETVTVIEGDLFTRGDNGAAAYLVVPAGAYKAADTGASSDLYYVMSNTVETFKQNGATVYAVSAYNSTTNKVEELHFTAEPGSGVVAAGKMYKKITAAGFDTTSEISTNNKMGFISGVVDNTWLGLVTSQNADEEGSTTKTVAVAGSPFELTKDTKYYLIDGENSKAITVADLAAQTVVSGKAQTIVHLTDGGKVDMVIVLGTLIDNANEAYVAESGR